MGIGWLSAPLSRGPDGLALDVQGTILYVAPVSTNYLSFVNSSVIKMRPVFAEKYMAVTVACVDSAAELVRVRQRFSFLNTSRGKSLVYFVAVKVVKLTHAIVRILERKQLEPEGG